MIHNYLVSIIVPMYNSGQYIKECINSLQSQSYNNIQIIVVDDCSTDDGLIICKEIAKEDRRIKIIELRENYGVAHARNVGIECAEGEYLAFVDSDDFVDENYIDLLISLKEKFPDSLILSSMSRFTNKAAEIRDESKNDKIQTIKKEDYLCSQYYFHPWACAALFEKNIVREYCIRFTESCKFGEDAYFVNKYLCFCRDVVISEENTYHYFIRPDGGAINRKDKKYSVADVMSRATSYITYIETIDFYKINSLDYMDYIVASYCFLAADILLMQLRAGLKNKDISIQCRKVLNTHNLGVFVRHCKCMKHTLLCIGMVFCPQLIHLILR